MSGDPPVSTYRLQLTPEHGFAEAAALVGYLRDLGIGAAYCSPVWRARRGSTHGYDVTDPTALNDELGGADGFATMARAFRRAGVGLVLDIVPNHMAASPENAWWLDVLTHGRASRYTSFFDIDWDGAGREGKVLLPVLGEPYGEALESGALRLILEAGALRVAYYDHRLPIDPADVPRVFDGLELDGRASDALTTAIDEASTIPPRDRTDRRSVARRARTTARVEALLRDAAADVDAAERIDAHLDAWSGTPGDAASFDRLDTLLEDQAYLPSYWRAALHEIDYRRFFDISDLISVRNDLPPVFDATHGLVRSLVRKRLVSGLRVDHVDGLRDPESYLERLRDHVGAPYVLVEKIVAPDEEMPSTWAVDGTTGYEFLRDAVGVMLDPDGAGAIEDAFRERTGVATFDEVVMGAKREVLARLFDSEIEALATRLHRLAIVDRYARDVPQAPLREALEAITAALPVYRTYIRSLEGPTPEDRARIEGAAERARQYVSPEAEPALAFCVRVLTLREARRLPQRRAAAWLAVVQRWQQLSGPAAAKGLEDTALYRDVALLARNDVGMEPPVAAIDVATFHERNGARAARWPRTMLATSTHDTKRGEDARMRLAVLAQIPDRWLTAVDTLVAPNDDAPDARERWNILQLALSIWPVGVTGAPEDGDDDLRERVVGGMRKSMREAKIHTDWLNPNDEHERAVEDFIRTELRPGTASWRALEDLLPDAAWHGAIASLSQVLMKIASPGVPDVYRGTELWDLNLVDPDNRRPYDQELRGRLLRELATLDDPAGLLETWPDGRVKFLVLQRALATRRSRPDVFVGGTYEPLEVTGPCADRVLALGRRSGDDVAVAVAPRATVGLAPVGDAPIGTAWEGTEVVLPVGVTEPFVDRVTHRPVEVHGGSLPLDEALGTFPVALLTSWR
jgi:(1->4)-alpha-D-glucan 1-alpha-D-glucosylmutase